MAHETLKAYDIRRPDYDRYLQGTGLDVGCGHDKLDLSGRSILGFDQIGSGADLEGDANILDGVAHESFDFLYSSHCLEHMHDVADTLRMWGQVVKSGGFLYVIVPDFVFYEQCVWPSRYNRDHKHAFTLVDVLNADSGNLPLHTYSDMLFYAQNSGLEITQVKYELHGYDLQLWGKGFDQTMMGRMANLVWILRKI